MNRLNTILKAKKMFVSSAITACLMALLMLVTGTLNAATALADKPLFSSSSVPGNVALVISAEFPTALGSAYTTNYAQATKYIGYFDSEKCYAYANGKITDLYNTGVEDDNSLRANGAKDLHWEIVSKPNGSNIADNIDRGHYLPSNTTSGTLGIRGTPRNVSNENGAYTYRTTFTIPSGTDLSQLKINFTLAYDDDLTSLSVNNVVTNYRNLSISQNGRALELNSSNSAFKIGANTIDIKIYNYGGDLGIRVGDMTTTASNSYFSPVALANNRSCSAIANGRWSGNFLNWILTQTVDPFRYALTGGYRSTDAVGLTVLEKAWASGQGGTVATPTIPNSSTSGTLIAQSTPFSNLTTIKFRIAGLGNKFYFTGSGNNDNPGNNLIAEGLVPAAPDGSKTYQMFARVKVCDPNLLESNCTKYPNGDYKPTGLMQKNAMKLNFAAFGYLNDSDILRDGGVLRAKMNPIGPKKTVPNSSDVTNANAEWNETTGIFNKNPDSTSSTASAVARSGAINYLNEFGLTTPGYKTYDPVGELYYTAVRYFKNQGNVASYVSNLDAGKKDGFPVIDFKKDSDNPVKYACQANFVIGIGDTNSWTDANLPGSTLRVTEPAIPNEVRDDNTVNVRTATNKVGELENLNRYGNLGERFTAGSGRSDTYFMSGLAYDAHTVDMQPNFPNKTKKITLETYWLDVLESGDRFNDGGTGMRNQFWLTAKYGGFNNVPETYLPYAATVGPVVENWDKDKDGDPDNYFRANNPKAMIDGLTNAFDDIAKKVGGSSIAFAVPSAFVNSGSMAFATSYEPDGWLGNIIGSVVTFDSAGAALTTFAWNADDKLEGQSFNTGWDTNRFIATAKCENVNTDGTTTRKDGTGGCVGVPFRLNALLTANISQLQASGDAQKVVNFIRGDRTTEAGATGFRIRKKLFGDIVNSKVVIVAAPDFPYGEGSNAGYSAFKTKYKDRLNVAYVGANDGLLHAIKATSDATGGTELFAYLPSQLFKGPNSTPAEDGVGALTKAAFVHHYYVDSTPVITDVNFGGGDTDWHSLLVGGLGKGGKGYYAIDVTNPATLSNETALASAVKWEFTHKDMGFSYGKPVITKVNINDGTTIYNGWAVIVASGYNTVNRNGSFFILNATTGALIKQIITPISSSDDTGLASLNVYYSNFSEFTADAAYAGDLLGNVWRLDLKTLALTRLAYLTDGSSPQPITTAPSIQIDLATGKRYVFVGTGKLLDDTDTPNTQTHSFYAINDGTAGAGAFLQASTLPSGVTFPIQRGNLVNNSATYKTTGVTTATSSTLGWFIDLEDKFRINVDIAANAGLVAFAANKTGGDECNPEGTSRTYLISYGVGKTVIPGGFLSYLKLANNVQFYKNTTGGSTNVEAVLETSLKDGSRGGGFGTGKTGSPNFKLLNWRDLPTAD